MGRNVLGLAVVAMAAVGLAKIVVAAPAGENALYGQENNVDKLDNAQLNAGGGGMPQTRRSVGWAFDNPNVKEFGYYDAKDSTTDKVNSASLSRELAHLTQISGRNAKHGSADKIASAISDNASMSGSQLKTRYLADAQKIIIYVIVCYVAYIASQYVMKVVFGVKNKLTGPKTQKKSKGEKKSGRGASPEDSVVTVIESPSNNGNNTSPRKERKHSKKSKSGKSNNSSKAALVAMNV